MHAGSGHLHSWEDLPGMVRLYFKIPHLDLVRAENFKVRFRQNHISVGVSWPQHLKQALDVGPFADSVDSKSIVVSRKGEQVVVSMAKHTKQKWDLLTKSGTGHKEIRIDHMHRGGVSTNPKEIRDTHPVALETSKKESSSKRLHPSDLNQAGQLSKVRLSHSNLKPQVNKLSQLSPLRARKEEESSHEGIEVSSTESSSTTPQKN
jgi:hypothetical protein